MAKVQSAKLFQYIAIISVVLHSMLGGVQGVLATTTTAALPKIAEIYPNAPGSAETGQEFIELYNPSGVELDLSSYILQIKDKPTKIMPLSGAIPASSYKAFITSYSLINSGEIVQLVKGSEVIEEVSYSSGAAENESWSYFQTGWELAPITKNLSNQKYPVTEPGPIDACPATPAIDLGVPPGYELNTDGVCVQIVQQTTGSCIVEISEVSAQPNYEGQEYIELFNRSAEPMSAELCKLKINGGAERVIAGSSIPAGGYHVVSFSSGIIRNTAGQIVLVNSSNEELQYSYPDTEAGQTVNYDQNLQGTLSDKPTPGAANELVYLSEEELANNTTSTPAECGPGKFRNPETNRCKTIDADDSSLAACGIGQERNPETNRCRKIASATSSLTPCDEGQERNPQTNRCRKIGSSESGLKPCDLGQERNPETNRCRKIASAVSGSGLAAAADPAAISPFKYKTPLVLLVLVAATGYGLYEYRTDLRNKLIQLREHFKSGRPPR